MVLRVVGSKIRLLAVLPSVFSSKMKALSQVLWVLNSATSCLVLCVFELNAGS